MSFAERLRGLPREQLLELAEPMAAEELRRSGRVLDPVAFARSLGITPDPWQERVLRWQGKRLLLNCSRQAGKSTTTAVLALHRALFVPKSLVLLVSPSLRQSVELFRKVLDHIGAMPRRPRLAEESKQSLRLDNGSRIVSLPSSEGTIRGYSAVSLICEDEAAFVDDDLNRAIRPMLAVSGGQLILMSTPNGRRGHFFEAWERGGDAWDRISVKAWDIPRISRDFLEAERRSMGLGFAQEYEGEFMHAATGLVYAGFDEKRNVVAEAPKGGTWHYVLSLDFGIVDQNALAVLGWREGERVVYVLEAYKVTGGSDEVAVEVRGLEQRYAFDRVVGDIGGMGKAFEHDLRTRHYIPIVPAQKTNKVGFISLVNDALRRGDLRVVATCRDLIEEWVTLPWSDTVADRRESSQREAPGYANHAADATLYGWRDCIAFVEEAPAVRAAPGTPEASAELERVLFAEHLERRDAEREDDPLHDLFG